MVQSIPSTVDGMIARLKTSAPAEHKRKVILVLSRHRVPRAADALVSLLSRSEPVSVRTEAAATLGRMGAGWAVSTLKKLVKVRNAALKRAARAALARLCPSPHGSTRFYLLMGKMKDDTPRRLNTGRSLLLHVARSFATRSDSIVRWPGCPGRVPKKVIGYEFQPTVSLTEKQGSSTLRASLVVVLHRRQALKGALSARATFDVKISRAFMGVIMASLTNALKQDLDEFLKGVIRDGV